jgi:hypothetical protein
MKTLKLLAFGIALLLAGTMQGQISVGVHLGTPPQWGPAGYSNARYYYLPDVEAYYDIQSSRFIYFDGKTWVHRANLPGRYRNYDLYNGYKVVMTDYHGNTPYSHFRDYKTKYHKGYRIGHQRNIGMRQGRGNSHSMNHPGANSHEFNRPNENSNRKNTQGFMKNEQRGNDHGQGRGNDRKEGHDRGNGNQK